jgi:hydrogenase nickel incorporation protein HypA/HybF
MHELSIALALVEMASEESVRLGDVRVDALHVRIGPLSGVVKEALRFSFDLAIAGSPIEGARIEFEEVPLTVFCESCCCERTLEHAQHLRCPVCHALAPDVRSGRELQLAALEVTDRAATNR